MLFSRFFPEIYAVLSFAGRMARTTYDDDDQWLLPIQLEFGPR